MISVLVVVRTAVVNAVVVVVAVNVFVASSYVPVVDLVVVFSSLKVTDNV